MELYIYPKINIKLVTCPMLQPFYLTLIKSVFYKRFIKLFRYETVKNFNR